MRLMYTLGLGKLHEKGAHIVVAPSGQVFVFQDLLSLSSYQ